MQLGQNREDTSFLRSQEHGVLKLPFVANGNSLFHLLLL